MFRAHLRKFRLPLITGGLSLALSMGAVVAWSVWSNNAQTGSILAATGLLDGDFDVANSDWRRSTTGFAELWAEQSNPDPYSPPCGPIPGSFEQPTSTCQNPVDPTTITTMPGDSFEYLMPLKASVAGTNLASGFTVEINSPDAATWDNENGVWDTSSGVLALDYYVAQQVIDSDGNPVFDSKGNAVLQQAAPENAHEVAGNPVTLPNLVPGSQTVDTAYFIVARVTVLGDYAWSDDPSFAADISGNWQSGTFDFSLIQVRGANS